MTASIASPIYNALGGLIGYVEGLAADGSAAVTDAAGNALGNLYNVSLSAIDNAEATMATTATSIGTVTGGAFDAAKADIVAAYDSAGNYIGGIISNAEAAISDTAMTVLKYGAIAIVGIVGLYMLVQNLESD